ncbi:MAG TPA: TolC family protein [Ramlibacter sp.]|nr:TolC family protein [Ramlibacter sp.]
MNKTLCALAVGTALAWPAAHAAELQDALRAAQLADPTLAGAMANRDAAHENIAIARARLLPQVNLQSTMQRTDQTTTSSFGTNSFEGPSKNTALSVRQGIYRPRDWAGVDVGKAQAAYGDYKLASAMADLWNRTTAAWIDVLAATAARDAYRLPIASAEASAQQEQRRLQMGDGTRDQAAEAAAQLVESRAQLANAESDLRARRQAFQLLTRLEPTGFEARRIPPLDRLPMVLPTEEDALRRIVDTNPELLATRAAEQVAERRLAQSSADHRPTLDLVAAASRAQNDSTNTLGTRYRNQQFGLQLQVPIYAGGGVSAIERQTAAQYAAASADRSALEQKLRTQVSGDYELLRGLRERMRSGQELLGAAREQKRGAELSLRGGLKTWADVNQADQLIARRTVELAQLTTGAMKVQSRLLALLPVSEPAWIQWTTQLSAAVR